MSADEPSPEQPLVVVCLRITDLRPRVDALTGAVRRDPWGIGVSPSDAAALEHALRATEAWEGRLLAVCAGPPAVEAVLRDVLALGGSVLRIPFDDAGGTPDAEELAGGEHGLARLIVDAISPFGRPALVLCGDRSPDRGTGALPAFVAHELGAAQALGLVHLDVDPDRDRARPASAGPVVAAERRLDGGRRERLVVPLPAVCSVEPAGVVLRRASLNGALAAERAPVPLARPPRGTVDPGGDVHVGTLRPFRPRTGHLRPPEGADPRARVLALTGALADRDPPVVVGPVDAVGAADAFVDFLLRHGYIDRRPGVGRRAGTVRP